MDHPPLVQELGTEDFLHRFFSPYKVPTGLTDEEVQKCVRLYPKKNRLIKQMAGIRTNETYIMLIRELAADYLLLERYRESYSKVFGDAALSMTAEDVACLSSQSATLSYQPVPLPPDLRQEPVTRESFSKGIAILCAHMKQLESTL